MKVAFVAHRANYLKHYGPIIDAALARGWVVECWLQDVSLGEKEYLRITPAMIAEKWGERVIVRLFYKPYEVGGLNENIRPDAVISLRPRNRYMDKPGSECFITLQHSVDLFAVSSPEELASSDYVCLYTPFWLEYGIQYYNASLGLNRDEVLRPLNGKIAYTGFAQMDAFANIDADSVRRSWNIPEEKKIILALPIDLAGWEGVWPFFFKQQGLKQWLALWKGKKEKDFILRYWRWALHGWNDTRLARVIQEFAERNNAVLILKGREKDPVRPAWADKAFAVRYDDAHYPATIFEAIAVADICILFYSTATQEAVYAGVPVICIDRPNKDTVKHQLWRQAHVGGPYNFPGTVSWQSLPDAIMRLPKQDLSDFAMDEQARGDYLTRYNGPADHKASQRILDLVKA